MSILTGPRAEAASGEKDSVVVFLHGYGADGNDLFGLAQAMAPHLPNTAFRSPNAPERCAVNPMGYQWFPISWLDGSPESAMQDGARRAVATLHAYFDEVLAEEGLTADRMAVVGFSQGTMMSLTVCLRRPEPFAGLVGFSGRLVADDEDGPITSKLPVLLIHGDQDEMVPVDSIHEARAALAKDGVDVRWHVSRGVGHGIAPDGLSLAVAFLRDKLVAAG
ncbi:MAG: prolyl oligopeptidase family serine peptidase [Pseudomonadota bacterium]